MPTKGQGCKHRSIVRLHNDPHRRKKMEAGAVSVRLHHGGPQGVKLKAEVVADILKSIKERRRELSASIAARVVASI